MQCAAPASFFGRDSVGRWIGMYHIEDGSVEFL